MRRLLPLLLLAACRDEPAPEPVRLPPAEAPEAGEPAKVAFDHILIAFQGAKKSKALRSREEAAALAEQLYDALKAGTDWRTTKEEFTDDRSSRGVPLGPYVLANDGVPHDVGEIPREAYSKDLADRLFSMKVGEYALVEYHRTRCPFGYHVLVRLQ